MCVCDIIQAYAYNSLGVFDPSVRLISGTKQMAPGNGVNLKYRFRQERNMRDA